MCGLIKKLSADSHQRLRVNSSDQTTPKRTERERERTKDTAFHTGVGNKGGEDL